MTAALALRAVAVAIAIAGLADPAVSMSRSSRQPLTIVILDTPSLDVSEAGGFRREVAVRAAQSLERELSTVFETTIRTHPAHSDAAPCAPAAACVVISDGARPRRIGERRAPLGGVRIARAADGVEIAAARAVPESHSRALGVVDVELSSTTLAGGTTAVEILDDGVIVGRATYEWPPRPVPTARVRSEWTPIAGGVRHLTVVARRGGGERRSETRADLAVEVSERRTTVLVHEPQPTWSGTFVRRALADDPRFRLLSRARLGGDLVLETAPVPLEVRALERAAVAVVVVTMPERLSAREIDALDRFVRFRGGSIVVLLDVPPARELRRLLPLAASARIERESVGIGPLRASELVLFRETDLATVPLAMAGTDAVVVSRSTGRGNVIAFGASDAWRYREQDDRFNAFWRGLVADAAAAAGDPLVLALSPSAVRPGDAVDVEVEWRSSEPPTELEIAGSVECDGRRAPVRLWPDGGPGRFAGTLVAESPGRCRVRAALSTGATASAPLVIDRAASVPNPGRDELSSSIAAYGGRVSDAGDLAPLISALRSAASPARVRSTVHVMRSPWWIVPFAACLAGEWWLRRRKGRR